MPPLNLLTAKYGVNFNEMAYSVATKSPKLGDDGKMVLDAAGAPEMIMQDYPILNYGPFLQTIVDFMIVAIAIFIAIRIFNRLKANFEEAKKDEPEKVSEDVELLREIRDSLKK